MTRKHTAVTAPRPRHVSRAWPVLCGLLALAGCAAPPSPTTRTDDGPRAIAEEGKASWYSDSLHGRTTASGERYDRNELTAAHRELPFGTRVRVTRTSTGRSVVVRINDRGPFVDGRIIDLSRRAAEELEMIRDGVVRVRVMVIE